MDQNQRHLPDAFKEKMRALLGEEYNAFEGSYDKERVQGLRFNTLKTNLEDFLGREYFHLDRIPWTKEGYYYQTRERPGKHPLHEAGLYYIQEPSAMAAVELLDPEPGERILDLCGAPGGKTTHIAARLKGKGLLVSNEIHPSRCRILSQNVERMGIGNAVVTNADAATLAARFPEYFDRIMVDAPCSGEGMFRKDEAVKDEWSPDHVKLCAIRQKEILDFAAFMLKPGGRMVYSTCTFSPEEDEGSVETFLRTHPEFTVETVDAFDGFAPGRPDWVEGGRAALACTFRIWPHKTKGEGHYLAVLKKEMGENRKIKRTVPSYVRDQSLLKEFRVFCGDTLLHPKQWEEKDNYLLFGDQLYLMPEGMPDVGGLKVMRPGLHLGALKKGRFEPSHALALFLKKEEVTRWRSLDSQGDEAVNYLKGGTMESANQDLKGWVLLCVDGYSLGWVKSAAGTFKNHYPKGLRWM